jgi:hypothetical protein
VANAFGLEELFPAGRAGNGANSFLENLACGTKSAVATPPKKHFLDQQKEEKRI